MKSNNKVIVIIIIIVLLITFVIMNSKKIKSEKYNNNNNNNISSDIEENEAASNRIKAGINGKTDKKVLSVNGEIITELDIALYDVQLNKSGNTKNINDEIIKFYSICQDAEERGLSLSDEDIKNIQRRIDSDEIKKLIEESYVDYNICYETILKNYTKYTLLDKWNIRIMNEIIEGKINIDNDSFKGKYKEFLEEKNSNTLLELQDIYAEYLVGKATIIYY